LTPTSNIDDLADKICYLIREFLKYRSRGLSDSVKKIIQEREFIDILQESVDYGNLDVLKSFKIRLQMEEHTDNDNFAKEESTA
jgi:hypothetical protein